jgi:hypothetical protein
MRTSASKQDIIIIIILIRGVKNLRFGDRGELVRGELEVWSALHDRGGLDGFVSR